MLLQMNDTNASYAGLQAAITELGDVKTIFYGVKPGSSPAVVEIAQVLFSSRDYYINFDLRSFPGNPHPLESTLLTDYPFAVNAYINGAAY